MIPKEIKYNVAFGRHNKLYVYLNVKKLYKKGLKRFFKLKSIIFNTSFPNNNVTLYILPHQLNLHLLMEVKSRTYVQENLDIQVNQMIKLMKIYM